jgi:lauroyl/myristoyl acyltransferase
MPFARDSADASRSRSHSDKHSPDAKSLSAREDGAIIDRAMSTHPLTFDMGAPSPDQPATGKERPIPPFTRARIAVVRSFLMLWVRAFGLSGLYALGRGFGTLEYFSDYNRRRRVRRKLTSLFKDRFSPALQSKITWRYFMRIRCDKMFYTIMDRIPKQQLMSRIKLIGGEKLDEALAGGNGTYVALCHFGSHLIAGMMMALLGYDIGGVRDPKESHVRRYIQQKYRETFPEVAKMKLFYATSFPRQIYRHLRANGLVASLLDVDRIRGDHTKTHPVDFLGEKREFLVGPVQMALRCGSPIFQGFVVSRKNFYYQMIVTDKLIDPKDVADETAALTAVMQTYADGVADFARRYPDHLMRI